MRRKLHFKSLLLKSILVTLACTTAAASPSITVFGRVQMTISPVPDFDRLLSLDSALARAAKLIG